MPNNKTNIILLLVMLCINHFTIAQTIYADVIVGKWLMPNEEGIIEICKDGDYYGGKIIWMQETEEDGSPLKDKNNPEDSLQNRELTGLKVMNNFKYKGTNSWSDGTFYAAKKGIIAEPEFELIDNNHLNICVSFFVFSKTIELTRVDTTQYFQKRKAMEK